MYNHRLKLALSFIAHVSLMAAAVSCGDDDDATGTDGETTGAGDSQGADCDNVAGTQPCNCLTTVVAVGKQTCTDEGWSACECPGACDELRAINAWCPNPDIGKYEGPLTGNPTDAECAANAPKIACACSAKEYNVAVAQECGLIPTADTGDTGE